MNIGFIGLDGLMAAGWGGEDTSRLLSVLERCHA
jgi:hypothetical protein